MLVSIPEIERFDAKDPSSDEGPLKTTPLFPFPVMREKNGNRMAHLQSVTYLLRAIAFVLSLIINPPKRLVLHTPNYTCTSPNDFLRELVSVGRQGS